MNGFAVFQGPGTHLRVKAINLRPFTKYLVQVDAKTSAGRGDRSTAVEIRTGVSLTAQLASVLNVYKLL